jgi:hypothetical protein
MNKFLFWCISIIIFALTLFLLVGTSYEMAITDLTKTTWMTNYPLTLMLIGEVLLLYWYPLIPIIYGILLISCFIKLKNSKIRFHKFFLKKMENTRNKVRKFSYAMIVLYVILYCLLQFDSQYFLKYHLIFFVLLIINTVFYTLWITHIFGEKQEIHA